ncbi:MAG: DUF115 domain-containing protein, partial [Sulfurimonas sp.]|nr:DUF115 domain-containing protein [Sulfurimonas sp.]
RINADTAYIKLYQKYINNGVKVLGFIDSNKIGDNICHLKDIDSSYDYIIIGKTQYWIEIYKQLNLVRCYYEINGNYHKVNNKFIDSFTKEKLKEQELKKNTIKHSINKLQKLKSIHVNKRAFIIGNGPSLKIEDLDKLQNEITFGCNKIFLAYNETRWRPTYYTIEDRLDVDEYLDKVVDMEDVIRFIPDKFLDTNKIYSNLIYYPYKYSGISCENFSNDINEGFYSGFTVVYTMLQLAVFMGIKEIYLLGVDFSYKIPNFKNQAVLEDEGERNHFHKDYRSKGDKWFSPNLDLQYGAFLQAKEYADKYAIKIFNSTKNTKLDIFENVNFNEIYFD